MKKRSAEKKCKSKNLRALALTQIFSLVLEIFAFTFIFGMSLGEVSGAGTPSAAVAASGASPRTTYDINTDIDGEKDWEDYTAAEQKSLTDKYKLDEDSYQLYIEGKLELGDLLKWETANPGYYDLGGNPIELKDLEEGDQYYSATDLAGEEKLKVTRITRGAENELDDGSGEVVYEGVSTNEQVIADAKTPTVNPNAGYNTLFGKIGAEHYIWGNIAEGLQWSLITWTLVQALGAMGVIPQNMAQSVGTALFTGIMAGKMVQIGADKGLYSSGWSLGVGILAAYLIFANQYKDTKTHEETIEFKCLAWQAPTVADKSERAKDCNTCNTDILKPCSEYRCKALGQSCKMINEGTALMKCIDGSIDDVNSPGIKPFNEVLTKDYSYEPVRNRPAGKGTGQASGMGIKYNGGCLKSWTPFDFGIITYDKLGQNQPAQCKIDFNHTTNFDAMTYWMGGSNLFIENHSQRISLPGTAALNSEFPEIQNDGEYKAYIRCRNGNGNSNDDEFEVSFCIDKTPDLTAPVIAATSPAKNSPVLYKIDNVATNIYTNEPANCKWTRKDSSYENMENSFVCSNDVWNMNAEALYPCTATLTGIKDKEANKFYFKCRDLSPQNNTMTDSYEYSLIGTQPLTILSTKPTGTIGSATSTGSVNFEVKTDNGYKNGEATCAYSTTKDEGSYIDMFDTGGKNIHAQSLDLIGGTYKYYFKCIDLGGNTAYNQTSFTVYIDKYAPEIVRAYNLESKIKLVTNEDAICKYSTTSCNFDINTEGIISMPFDWTREHWAEWKTDQTYYIKCMDKFNNQPNPDACSIIAKPYELSKKA